MRKAAKAAAETPGGVLIQDTAWEGYEEIPSWIMQGYGTMAMEADEQFAAAANAAPTHVFVQAGVGSLAGAVVGYFANKYHDNPPVFAVVESDQADCLYRSACAGDGSIRTVGGDMRTIMAGARMRRAKHNIVADTQGTKSRPSRHCRTASPPTAWRVLGAPLPGRPRASSRANRARPRSASSTR